jgi:hypothetical protein
MAAVEFLQDYLKDFNRQSSLWRYMDLKKFQLLIDGSAIWFSRVDRFDDAFEGAVSEITRKVIKYGPDVTPEMIEHFNKVHVWQQQWTYATCWHNSEQENALMWAAYAPKGVAIRTKYETLATQLPQNAVIAPVLYRDYSNELVSEGTQIRYFQKRHYFKDEKEVRSLIVDFPEEDLSKINLQEGNAVAVDLSSLLDAIICRPYASKDEVETITKIVNLSGIKVPVVESELSGNLIPN